MKTFRSYSTKQKNRISIPELSENFKKVLHGRKGKERNDSITLEILNERIRHQERIKFLSKDGTLFDYLEKHGLGKKKKNFKVYNNILNPRWAIPQVSPNSLTGAGTRRYLRKSSKISVKK